MRLRTHMTPPLFHRPREKPRGIDESDWIDVVNNVPVDDELASIYETQDGHVDRRTADLRDFIDRRGLDLDL
jgi:hypothetical protein